MEMDRQDLKRTEFFDCLTDEELDEFLEGSERVNFVFGEEIISEGREPECMFVITSGKVDVVKDIPGGERVVAKISAGQSPTVVGERGLMAKSGASATVRAGGDVEAVRVRREAFRQMIRDGRPAAFKVSYRISRTIARRLTRLDEEVVEMIRNVENSSETDLEAFRDRLVTDWTS